ncbi:hypothetical protein WJX74_003156 [Apatococcus lobatus]|uniref:F-box domain-containing protein n=1 Tax=Apatococcus lobatus TaxID=904363 RepID=A0AAW1RDF1_9CHLO
MGRTKNSVRPRKGTRTSSRRKPEPQHSSNCYDRRGRLAKKKGPAFLLWHTLPEGPLLRVFELVYEETGGNDELRSAALVCRAWREAAQEILLGDTAASRPHRAPLLSASEVSEPKQTLTTCRAVVLEPSRSISSGNEACSKRRAIPTQHLPFNPLATAKVPARGLGAPWNVAPARAQLPGLEQGVGEDVSQGGGRAPTLSPPHSPLFQAKLAPVKGSTQTLGLLLRSQQRVLNAIKAMKRALACKSLVQPAPQVPLLQMKLGPALAGLYTVNPPRVGAGRSAYAKFLTLIQAHQMESSGYLWESPRFQNDVANADDDQCSAVAS